MHLDSMMIGTLFDQEEVAKKKNFHNIEARDDKGRKHFHGSFTGGFSAGYKGTCGSKEGWAPSTFISSRSQRNSNFKQTIHDYMEEDDYEGNVAGETITARQEFDTLGERQNDYLQKDLGRSILGSAPEELLVSAKTSVGYEILRNLDSSKKRTTVVKKEPKKIYGVKMENPSAPKPRAYENETTSEEVQEYSTGIPKANAQFTGLNYKQLNFQEDEYEAVFNKIFKKYTTLDQPEEETKAKESNRIKMQISGFEDEDYDPSKDDSLSKFIVDENDTHIEEDLLRNAKRKKANNNALLEFEKDPQPYRVDTKKSQPEEIPKDWDPFKKVKERLSQGNLGSGLSKSLHHGQMNPGKRAELLGEDQDILEQKLASISEETKKKIMNVKTFVRGETQSLGANDLNLIFKGDKDKIERYKYFSWEKMGKLVSGIPPGNMSYDDLKREKEEFEKIYEMQQNKAAQQTEEAAEKHMTEEERKQAELLQKIDELKKNIQKERGRRKIEYWVPDRILCRRFNVPQPKTERRVEENDRQDKFAEQILPAFLGNKGREVPRQPEPIKQNMQLDDMPIKEFKSNKFQNYHEAPAQEEAEEEPEEEVVEEEKPPLELFQSIFGDEDEEK